MLEQRSDSLQVNTAQSQARVLSLEQEKVCIINLRVLISILKVVCDVALSLNLTLIYLLICMSYTNCVIFVFFLRSP